MNVAWSRLARSCRACVTRTGVFGRANRLLLCFRILPSDFCFQTRRAGPTRSGLCALSFTMLVLHPTSSCDICYDTYGQDNPASTIPCGHIFCCRYASPGCPRRNTRQFHSSVFVRIQLSFRVPTERVPVVSKEVLEIQCHKTQDGRGWGWWGRSDDLQSNLGFTEHIRLSV